MRIFVKYFLSFFFILIFFGLSSIPVWANPSISNINDNKNNYLNNTIPVYEKFEVTFTVATVSQNPFLPYDDMLTPIPGLTAKKGVSVDGLFLPPGETDWNKSYRQPGFYYYEYTDGSNSQYFPTGKTYWKVRFAPPACPGNTYPCTWQYKIAAKDATGMIESAIQTMTVTQSNNHGFIRVSKRDPRYFEFSDGTYFPGLAINEGLNKTTPASSQTLLTSLSSNGIQVVRFWLSQWGIFGSQWTNWEGSRGETYNNYFRSAGLITNRAESTTAQPQSMLTLVYTENAAGKQNPTYSDGGSFFDACYLSVSEGGRIPIATKTGVSYHVKVRYQAKGITGPRDSRFQNYGLIIKSQNPNDGSWHTSDSPNPCWNGGVNNATGVPMTGYGHDTSGWTVDAAGNWTSPNWSFLEGDWTPSDGQPTIVYFALENVKPNAATIDGGKPYNWRPYAYIDSIEIHEKLPNGQLGPNLIPRGSMSYLEQINDRPAYAFDKAVDMAKNSGIYLKTVILDKNEQVEGEMGANGQRAEFTKDNFYGSWRTQTAGRWYQQAWYRYLQARWGYSTAIHSWEFTNEGQIENSRHWSATDELAKYMKCTVFGIKTGSTDGTKCTYENPNAHLSTTSFEYGFSKNSGDLGWANPKYPNIDYADIHDYINKPSEPAHYFDTALSTYDVGNSFGAKQQGGAGMPIIRGETALIIDNGTGENNGISQEINTDTKGVWLHNFIWGQINPFGATEAWWHVSQIYSDSKDLKPLYKSYYDFISNVPLSNGTYQDAAATATDSNVRVWGQKDNVGQAATHAHIWIQNKKNLWCTVNAISGCPTTWDNSRLNGTVTIAGFAPNTPYPIEWWNFDRTVVLSKITGQSITSNASGQIVLNLASLPATVVDTGVKIGDYFVQNQPTNRPSPTGYVKPCSKDGDTASGIAPCDGVVNINDFTFLSGVIAKGIYDPKADVYPDGAITIQDYTVLSNNFGK